MSAEIDEILFSPRFNRYPLAITSNLVRIGKAQAIVESARILPAQEDILRVSSLAETVHFSTLLEGNHLTQVEAERALRHELDAQVRAEVELVNYVSALTFIEDLVRNDKMQYDVGLVLELHRHITQGLGREGTFFEPRHEGNWRDGIAIVPGPGNVIEHIGAPAEELDQLMRGVMTYLSSKHHSDDYPGAVLAGVVHHAITDLHPFADGNGRTARALAFGVLMNEGVIARRMFSPDRHYAINKPSYLSALRSAKRLGASNTEWTSPGNLEEWLTYYTNGLAEEYERTAGKVVELNRVADQVTSAPIQLTPSQSHSVSVLSNGDRLSISRREYQAMETVSEDRAQREIATLVKVGILVTTGRGSGTRYRLPGHSPANLKWTDGSIEIALTDFLANKEVWPRREEFLDAGLSGLYVAMSKNGGIKAWRTRMGHA